MDPVCADHAELETEKTVFNPFDLTKVWPHGDCPLREVVEMELNSNPENYFSQIEQVTVEHRTGDRLLVGSDAAGVYLLGNIAAAMAGVPDFIIERQLAHLRDVHPDYDNGVRAALKSARS